MRESLRKEEWKWVILVALHFWIYSKSKLRAAAATADDEENMKQIIISIKKKR